jgi:DMSO reductase anchor subunit
MGKLPLALCGLGLIYSMAQVYRLRSIPAWDTNRTLLEFSFSALVLGGFGLQIVDTSGEAITKSGYLLGSGLGLIGAFLLLLTDRDRPHRTARRLRLGLIALGLAGVLRMYLTPVAAGEWLAIPIFLILLSEEVIGRCLFYDLLRQRVL